eukprot:TRINITY_DN557_c0_g1_i2.p2 TRINITY_DN557_c0_g1~~TRINITY_DN557_c0_g1_i2.p2  ORF type:complete len:188 (-),score=70.20 TRINITY_DN557_c0_g1_i2:106-669(-)
MKKYGAALFQKGRDGKYGCFFEGCNQRMVSNFSRHITLHEKQGHKLKPEMAHLTGNQDLLFVDCNGMFKQAQHATLYEKLLQKADAKRVQQAPEQQQPPAKRRRQQKRESEGPSPSTSPVLTPPHSPSSPTPVRCTSSSNNSSRSRGSGGSSMVTASPELLPTAATATSPTLLTLLLALVNKQSQQQ